MAISLKKKAYHEKCKSCAGLLSSMFNAISSIEGDQGVLSKNPQGNFPLPDAGDLVRMGAD